MESIIFQNVIDKVNTASENVSSYFNNIDYYNDNIYDLINKVPKYNIIIYIFIIFIIFNFIGRLKIRLNEILVWMICVVLIYILLKKDYTQFIDYTIIKKNELNFLHKLMFDGKWDYERETNLIIKPINSNNKSYLYLNPLIVQFFYNIREYSQYNISSYVNSLIHCNNVISYDYQCKLGLNNEYDNYTVAVDEVKKALNELNSVIYNLPSTLVTYDKFHNSIKMLHGLLNQHIQNMSIIIKNKNKTTEINLHDRPDNFYDDYFVVSANDTKEKGYISTFNMY
jgi:hypothetical protein